MNKYLYHVIFNERRGQCIVVPERVSGGAHKEGGSATVNFGPGPGFVERRRAVPILRPLALVLRSAFGVTASIAVPAYAQIIADPNAPGKQRPTVLQTGNGVVQVNIQTPSQAGVSRNTYTQFDVTRGGAVLNNSRNAVQTQIGGWVQGNPWLLSGPARVILNEVNSPNPSQLRGFLEVAGNRAEIVIANSSGIDVDGAGFINANRVTLTTGVPKLQDGNLEGFSVQQGRVSVAGQGLDAAQADYAGILARAVTVNASIWAKDLQIVTGANQIDAAAAVVPTSTSGSTPAFALDVSQLGGMYAGQIKLIGTEAGVGVRNTGEIAAASGNLVLNADGWLTNSGTIVASAPRANADIAVSGDIKNSGTMYASGDIHVTSQSNIANARLIAAQNNASVLAAGATSRIDGDAGATFASGLMADGTMQGTGNLSLKATNSVSHHGAALAGASIRVDGGAVDLSHASVTGGQINAVAQTENVDASGATITAKGLLVLNSAKAVDTHASKVVADELRIEARDWSNVGGEVLQSGSGNTAITLTGEDGTLDNTSGRIAVNSANLTLGAGRVVNTDGRIEHSGPGTLAIQAQSLDDVRGTIIGNGVLDITAASFDHRNAATSAHQLNVAAASLDNDGGRMSQVGAGAGVITVSGSLSNVAGIIESNGDVAVNAGALDNSGGKITAIGSAAVAVGGGLSNANGLIAAGINLAVQSDMVDNSHGTLQAQAGDTTVRAHDLNNANGSIFAAGTLDTVASNLVNAGTMYAGGDQNMAISGAISNSGVIAARGGTTVQARSLSSDAGSLLGAGLKADGTLAQNGALSITTTDTLAAHGQNLAGGQTSLQGATVDVGGSQTAGASIALDSNAGDVTTSGATVATDGTLAISATTAGHGLVNSGGTLSGAQLDVRVANLDNRQGTLIQSGTGDSSIALDSPNGVLDNTGGRISVNASTLNLKAAALINVDGHIEHAGTGALHIGAGTFNDERGTVASNGTLALTADALNHNDATTSAAGVSVHAGMLSNRGGHLLQGGAGSMKLEVAGKVDNSGGEIASESTLGLQAGAIDNINGHITSGDLATVSSAGQLNNTGGVVMAAHSLTAAAGGAVDNTGGALQAADGALTLDSASLRNSKGMLSAGTNLTARIAGDLSNDSVVYAGQDQALNVGGALTNAGSIAALGDTTIVAASLDSGAGGLLGAGIRADGSLGPSGSLSVQTTGSLVARGQNLAARNASMSGASVDVRGSDTAGGNVTLAAGTGDVHTAGANVNAVGTLNVIADHLDNVQGSLGAAQLTLHVANLDNRHGTLIQSGTDDSSISMSSPSGVLDNTGGRIAVNANNLNVTAATLTNVDGHIEHAGTGALNVVAGTFNDERGGVASNGTLGLTADMLNHDGASTSAARVGVHAGTLSNRGGHLVQGDAGSMALVVAGQIDNAGGEIASEGSLGLQAGALDNSNGRISVGDSATVSSAGQLNNTGGVLTARRSLAAAVAGVVDNTAGALQARDGALALDAASLQNSKGVLSAGTDLTARIAGNLASDSVVYAGRNQALNVGGVLTNTGSIAAQGDMTIAAASVDSGAAGLLGAGIGTDGSLAQSGSLTVQATGNLVATGQNLAAGSASLSGASVDVRGSHTAAGNVTLSAGSGDVHTGGATVSTGGTLSLTGGHLDNVQGSLSAAQLALHVANLDNTHGTLFQTGTGDTEITLSARDGRLDNTAGYIAVNSNNLALGAGTLVNTDGKIEHAGAGTLAIRTGTLDGQRGQLATNGALEITATAIDHRGATMAANQIAITATSLDNHGGHIAQLGTGVGAITLSGSLDNGAGSIDSNGDAKVNASLLDNNGGRITAAGSAAISAHVGLNNTEGLLAAGMHLAVEAGNVDNSGGNLQAQGGDATLHVGDLNNTGGTVYAAGKLDTVTANLANTGSMYAGGDLYVQASGAVANSGVIAAQDNTTVDAHSLSGEAGSMLGAGLKADGTLAQNGTLNVTTTGALVAHGQSIAAGKVSMQGASVDVGASQTGGTSIALRANTGDITTSGATVATDGTLAISANTEGHGLVNSGGTLSGAQFDMQVANFDNTQGSLIQSGTADSIIAMSSPNGRLDNTGGRIAVNAHNLNVSAAALTNVDGHIEHAGTGALSIGAGTFNDERGSVASNGSLALTAGSLNHNDATTSADGVNVHTGILSNRGGHLLQAGAGSMTVEVAGQVDNAGGEIAGEGSLDLHAGALDNNHGRITSANSAIVSSVGQLNNSDGVLTASHALAVAVGATDNTGGALQAGDGALTLDAASLQNSKGVLSAGTDLVAHITGDLSNDSVMYAGRDQVLNAGGMLTNTGSIAARGDMTIVAGSVDSAGGLFGAGVRADGRLAQSGSLMVQSQGTLLATGRNLAARDASLSGASIDVRGSDTAGANVSLAATSGDVHTADSNVSTAGTLSMTADHLDNARGNLSAGQLSLHVANLDNTHGMVLQTGTGDTDITLSAPNGTLDNTSGHIAVNSTNLTLGAGTLVNTEGKIEHAGAGTLAIRAGTLDDQGGQIAANGRLDIAATAIDHRDATTSANLMAVTAASLDNHGGHIAQLGAGAGAITVSASLDNGAGSIASNGDATVNAGMLDNSGGRITAAGSAAIGAHAGLNNTDGLLAAGMNLAVEGGNVDNSRGTVQAQGGDATLRVGDLNNMAGTVYAAGRLDTVSANVANTGSMYAGGDQHVEVSGAVTNSGVIAAEGNTTLNAHSLLSIAGSVLGAGVNADGTLGATGNLNATTTDALAAHGQNLAAGNVSLQGSIVDLSASQTSGAGVALHARTGDVTTSGATVATAGTLGITATTEGHGLVNSGGTLNGGQFDLHVANLENRQGTLTQSGTADSSITMSSPSGVLDNTGGRIAVNANNLNVTAATLINVGGQIEHAGTGRFDLTAGGIYDQHGEIISNGAMQVTTGTFDHREAATTANALVIRAGTLDNGKGLIVQKGRAGTSISTSSALNNSAGTIASNGNTTISASALNNANGTLTSAGAGNLDIHVSGNVDNGQGGLIAAAGDVGISAGAILNQSGAINSGGTLKADAVGEIQNSHGTMIAHGNAVLTAAQLTNSLGTVATELGNLSINTSGATNNDSGVVQAGGDITLTNSGLSNARASGAPAGGSIVGRNVDINTNGQALSNQLGTIASSQNLSVNSGALDNAGGLIQSGGALSLDTHGGDLDNSQAGAYASLHSGTQGGIVSDGDAQIRVGAWNNAGGFFGAGGIVDALATGQLDNTAGGQIVSGSDSNLTASSLDNRSGQIQSLSNLSVTATTGNVGNSGGLMRSGGTLAVSAGSVDNSNTQGAGTGLEGRNIVLTTSTLNNDHGAVRADENADIHSGVGVINTQGLISAGNTLAVSATPSSAGLSIDNSGGTLIGGSSTNIKAASIHGGGHLLSLGDMTLDLSGDFVQAYGGDTIADKNLNLKVAGDLSNFGKLSAGGDLDISAHNIANAASAEISSSGVTHVAASDTLHNRGLIDGNATELDAGTIDNSGTGRIYGGHVGIAAGSLTNDVENNVAGTIAARSRLDIGVQTLSNREHGLIFSGGDLSIGGALDANRTATGRADVVTNASASIEAMGNLFLEARQVNNLNNHFTTELRVTKTEPIIEYAVVGNPRHYSPDEARPIPASNDPATVTVLHVNGGDQDNWSQYNYIRTTQETVIASSDPGRIASGGLLMISGDGVLNDNSHIIAGGYAFIFPHVTNSESPGQKITSDVGTEKTTTRRKRDGHDISDVTPPSAYQPPATIEPTHVSDSRVESQTAAVDASAPGQTATGGVSASTSSAGQATAPVQAATIAKVSTSSGAPNAASGDDAARVSAAKGAADPDIGDGSARLVSIGSATGEHASVSGSSGQAGPVGPMPVEYSSREMAESEVSHTSGAMRQDHAGGLDADSARLVSIGSAKGEHTAVAGPGGQASSSDPTPVGFSGRQLAMSEVGPSSGLPALVKTSTTTALPHQRIDPATGLPVSELIGPAVAQVGSANGIDPSGRAQAPGVTQAALEKTERGAPTVRTVAPSSQLPGTSLFQVDPSPSASYLIETDPRFANYQQWTGSEYMLAQMKFDPALTQKRLGDGFYEQKLVRDQVAQLTGQRFLGDFTSDDEQYCALMDAGIEYAKTLNLRPGVALTAEQMGAITKDMVWLVAQEVTLADGTVQTVLAPQVYVASHENDLTGAGAVISGHDVKVASTGNLTNTGSIFARDTAQIVADNINNLGGRIHADSVLVNATTDINNIGGTISAGHELIARAGRDINVETTTRSASSSVGGNEFSRTTIERVGSLSVTGDGGTLVASAGRDINLVAAKIDNAGKDGNTLLDAGRNLNVTTVTTASSNAVTWDPVRHRNESSSTEVGTVIQGAGAITFKAGADINLRAASVDAGKDLTAIAGHDLNILAGVGTTKFDEANQTTSSGFLHHETITTRNTLDGTSAIGSVIGGATVNLAAGHDLKVVGSSVVGDDNVNLVAKNAISIEAATNQSHETHYSNVQESGLLSGGGFGISFGKRTTTTNQDQDASTQSGQARSTVGSISGNLTISAGDSIKIAGTDLAAGNDINLVGKSVSITPGVDDVSGKFTSKMTQDALTLSVGGSVVNAIQNAQSMATAAGQTSNGRLKALAAASAAMTAHDAATDLSKNGRSVKVSLTVGHSESESTELTASSTHGGSVLTAGNNVNIVATGGGKASNIDIVGSDVHAKGDVSLAADNQVDLLAAQDTESQHSQSKSWSASVGVAAEFSASAPAKIGITASASASRGNVDGEGATQVDSHVSAGGRLTIASGGDTNLKGAVASGSQVVADIKGNLNIESLQDTATLDGKRQSVSASATFGPNGGLSASASQSKVHNDYASVQEQSGLRAGDGGFQVQVAGNTDLKGGVISSTEQAIKDGRNSLATATLSFSDVQNRDSTNASGLSLGINVGKNQNGSTFSPSMAPGVGQVSGGHDSVTRSGISGATLTVAGEPAGQAVANLNRDVGTGKDTAQALTKSWTGAQALDDVGAQMQITSAALPRLAKEIGDYAEKKAIELKKEGNAEEAAKWAEGGVYRVAAHAALGAVGGGFGGAVGAAGAAEAAQTLSKLQDGLQNKLADAGLSNSASDLAAKLIAGGMAGAIGSVAGGGAGAMIALNEDVNNRQLHPGDYAVARTLAKLSGGQYTEKEILDALRYSGLQGKEGNIIVREGTRETFVNLTNIATGTSLLDTVKADPTMAFEAVPNQPKVLLEQALVRPSNDLMGFIVANTGGTASPYVMTPAKTYTYASSLPAAPEGTTRVTMTVDGVAYFPLVAACPAVSCTNGDPIAFGIEDSGTTAYIEALKKKDEKYFNIGTGVLGLGGALVRGVSNLVEVGGTGTSFVNTAIPSVALTSDGLNAMSSSKNYGVTFFSDDILPFYAPTKATIGNPNGAPSFFMTLEDSSAVKNAHDAAVYTGMAPSAQKAYVAGGDIYGFSFPTDGLAISKPSALDAGGWPHFLEGGNTAVKLEGPNAGYMVTPVKEFITSGNSAVPRGSVLFKLGPDGEWITIRKW